MSQGIGCGFRPIFMMRVSPTLVSAATSAPDRPFETPGRQWLGATSSFAVERGLPLMASGSGIGRPSLPATFAQYRPESFNGSVAGDDLMSEMGRSAIADGDLCVLCNGRVPQFIPPASHQQGSGHPTELVCMWCARPRVIMATAWTSTPKPAEGDQLWISLQGALQMLVVEGVANIDETILLDRVGMSSTTASVTTFPAPSSPTSSTSAAVRRPQSLVATPPPSRPPAASSSPSSVDPSPLRSVGAKLAAAAHIVASPSPFKRMATSDQAFGPPPASYGERPRASVPAGSADGPPLQALPADESDWHTTLPLTSESLDGDLPSGSVYTSLRHQRQTINEMYADRVCCTEWFDAYQLQTAQALVRRFRPHADKIIGKSPNVDIEIGYRPLDARIMATIDLQKSLHQWINHQADYLLVAALKPMAILQKYLDATSKSFAPDLEIIRIYAVFPASFRSSTSLSEALATVDIDCLKRCRVAILSGSATYIPPKKLRMRAKTPTTATEPVEEGGGDDKCGSPKSKKSTKPPAKVADRLDVTASAEFHIQRMVSDAAKSIISLLPGRACEFLSDLRKIVDDFKVAFDMYLRFGFDSPPNQADSFPELLSAIATLFQCCFAEDRERPPTGVVREARRLVFSLAQNGGPGSELGKAMLAYPCGQCLMSVSADYSASGIEDSAAEKLLESIIEVFEESFESAFTDAELWAQTSADGSQITLAGLRE